MSEDNNDYLSYVPPFEVSPTGVSAPIKDMIQYLRFLRDRAKISNAEKTFEKQEMSRSNPTLYKFLNWLYSDLSGNRIMVENDLLFPLAIYHAPKSQRDNIESPLGDLDVTRTEYIDNNFNKAGQSLHKLLHFTKRSPWDDPTYIMQEFSHSPELKIHCSTGSYLNMVKSCEIFEFELLDQIDVDPLYTEDDYHFLYEKLVLRKYLHSLGNPIFQSLGRSVAVSISTPIIFLDEDGHFKALVRERSKDVAVAPSLLHVLPSFMFQPLLGLDEEEFSVENNIYREYLEEVFNREDLIRTSSAFGADFFYDDPNLQYLSLLEKEGLAKFLFTGIAVNLLSLRPEICTVLFITDPAWFNNQRKGSEVKGLQLSKMLSNWEFVKGPSKTEKFGKKTIMALDLGKDLSLPKDIFKPENFVPVGAATLKLAVDTLRDELNIS